MKKIAFLLNDLDMGGAERCAVLVAQQFVQRGHQVTLVLLRRNTNFWGDMPEGIDIVDISQFFRLCRLRRWWQILSHIADSHDVMIGGNILWPTYVMYCLSWTRRCQMIAWVHGPMTEIDKIRPFRLFHRVIGRWIYRQLTKIVFVSVHARESMSQWLSCPVKPSWQVIPNFVPVRGWLGPARAMHTPLRLLFIGRLSPEKSPILLIETLAALHQKGMMATLMIVGDGECMSSMKQVSHTYAMEQYIYWEGSQHDIYSYLETADLLLLTSKFEGCPLVVLEAMQSALPIISTRVGGVPELLGELSQQLLVEHATANALSQAIMDMLPHYTALSLSLLSQSQTLTAEKIMPAWIALIGEDNG